jgi:hypothetical protein
VYDGLRLARAFAEKPAHEPTSKKGNGGGERSESLISVDCIQKWVCRIQISLLRLNNSLAAGHSVVGRGHELDLMRFAFMVVSGDGLDHGKLPKDGEFSWILIHQVPSHAAEFHSSSLALVHSITCLTVFPETGSRRVLWPHSHSLLPSTVLHFEI